jgi:hypothetical protein
MNETDRDGRSRRVEIERFQRANLGSPASNACRIVAVMPSAHAKRSGRVAGDTWLCWTNPAYTFAVDGEPMRLTGSPAHRLTIVICRGTLALTSIRL